MIMDVWTICYVRVGYVIFTTLMTIGILYWNCKLRKSLEVKDSQIKELQRLVVGGDDGTS